MKHRTQQSVETPIASLIDVVFLLIIFFVVTAAVEKDVVDETITLAQAKHVPALAKKDRRTIVVNVSKEGDMNIALQPVSPKSLQNILTAARQKSGDAIPVVLRADGDTVYRDIDRATEVIGKSGLSRVRLAAKAPGQ
ncbi:MAG: biopolymer transporter ExbD [Victivallales bacterium]|mgnify:CR=1 FL=1|nr:biopolymer transporter ExbD [Victivallales bacterium]MBT7298695.1 biopolymer transporter ExbD [Victivallales bacterium]